MNLALSDVGGAVLAVSQFTLAADLSRGRRPGFDRALRGPEAEPLYERFVAALRAQGLTVATGVFGAIDGRRARQRGPGDVPAGGAAGSVDVRLLDRREREAQQEDRDAGERDELAAEIERRVVVVDGRVREAHHGRHQEREGRATPRSS